jgi:hypothetical protein
MKRVGKKAGGSRHLYGMGSRLLKRLENACLCRNFLAEFTFWPSPAKTTNR